MIPSDLFTFIKNAANINHGAQLERGTTTYLLKQDRGSVKAFRCIEVNDDESKQRAAKKGYEVGRNFAFKEIAISSIPDSKLSDWDYWDEY